jgi:hypothetical protein
MIAGNIVGSVVQASAGVAASMVSQSGKSATQIGSLLASTAAAATVGAAFMIGSTIVDLFTRSLDSQKAANGGMDAESGTIEPSCYIEEIHEENDFILRDFLLCDVSTTAKPPCSDASPAVPEQTEQVDLPAVEALTPNDPSCDSTVPNTDQEPLQMPEGTPLLSTSME